jgi:kynureninase
LPGICSFNTDETVLAHLNGGGMALKKHDIQASFACYRCHTFVDGGKSDISDEYVELAHRQGVERTQMIWLQHGFIVVL